MITKNGIETSGEFIEREGGAAFGISSNGDCFTSGEFVEHVYFEKRIVISNAAHTVTADNLTEVE